MYTKAVVALSISLVASPVWANNTGIFGKSGRDTEAGTCTQCHLGDNGTPPTITVKGLEGPITTGSSLTLTLTVTTNDPSGGIASAACPDRCAGINAAVDVGAGAFVVPQGSPLQLTPERDELSHIAKSPFIDGEVSYEVVLASVTNGDHTLFVAANDVDGQDFTGDRVATVAIPFTVTAPEPPPDDVDAGGCSQAGAAPLAVLLLAFLRRRRA